jgi:hydrogenase large subunit
VGPDHPDRRQPRHLHEDRLRDNREVVECNSTSSIFRGYSVFMKGKDPRDAHFITSRICGICGDNHATCSCYAQNMAYGVKPPPLGEWIVNLGEAAEYMFDHNIFQDNLVVRGLLRADGQGDQPGVLEKAEKTEAPHADDPRLPTIADIMRSLNPFTGEFYREALQDEPLDARDVLPDGGAPRAPLDALPGRRRHGGDAQLFTDYLSRLMRYVDFMKKVVRCTTTSSTSSTRRCPATRRSAAADPARLLGRVQGPRARATTTTRT